MYLIKIQKCTSHYLGVSKPSCPICMRLLDFLRDDHNGLVVRTSHSVLSPCGLPPWLPLDIVRDMVDYYERYLGTLLPSLCHEKQERCDSLQSIPFSATSEDNDIELEFYEQEESYDLEDLEKFFQLSVGT